MATDKGKKVKNSSVLTFDELLRKIFATYRRRNWAGGGLGAA